MVHVSEFSLEGLEYEVCIKFSHRDKAKYQYINIPCAFDIETTSTYVNGQKFAFMYEWTFGIKDSNYICYGRTWEEFIELCEKVADYFQLSGERFLVCYIHNMSFEFQFMRKYFDWFSVFAVDDRKPIKALCTLGIEFRDSYILSGYSLAKVADNLTTYKIKKLVGDLDYDLIRTKDTELTEKELAYCNNDVEIILAYIAEQITQYENISRIPLTNTGRVRKFVRDKCLYTNKSHKKSSKSKFYRYRELMKELVLTVDEYAMLKRCFMGGYTHASMRYSGETLHDMDSIDFTSSYPYVMLSEQFPMSRPIKVDLTKQKFTDLLKNFCLMFDVCFVNLRSKLTYDSYLSESKCSQLENPVVNNGRVYSADKVVTTITDVDYEIMRENYEWDEMYIGDCYKFYKQYLPRDVILAILELYGNKTTLKGVEGKEVEYLLSKGMLNSVYGMTVTDIVRGTIDYNSDSQEWTATKPDADKFAEDLEKYNNDVKRFLYYPWGVWVTAYARRNLWTGIIAFGEDYVYSDTDSIKCRNIEKHRDYIETYNQRAMQKLQDMCKFRKIDFSLCSPKTIEGVEKPLGVWDWETQGNNYKTFKTLGAKRYMYQDKKGLHITIAGLSKQNGVQYILEKSDNDLDKCFDFFDDNMSIPAEYTGKMTHTYIDDEMESVITDYQGNKTYVKSLSSVHLEKCEFTLSISKQYADFLSRMMQGYIYKGVKAK